MHAQSLQLCPTLCDPMGCNPTPTPPHTHTHTHTPTGSSVYGILHGRILVWIAMSSFRASSLSRDLTHVYCVSCVQANFLLTEPPGQIDGETVETVTDFIFLSSKIIADGDFSHEIKRCLLLGRKVMTNLDSILKIRDITLPTKIHLVKAMVFPVVMYGCESWTIKKAEC